jgi:putative (di)nucleoside polyphosphate hydrolase
MTPAQIAKLPYRRNVGIMVINAEGLIWTGRRSDRHSAAWQMPQGGIDAGEDPQTAALRELEEEIGVSPDLVEIVQESADWLAYDLPLELVPQIWKGRYRGQEQKWFLLRFLGTDDQINIATEQPEFIEWRWMRAADMPDAVVPFKREVYEQVIEQFSGHLA